MNLGFEGKVAIVTGAGSGIGAAVSRRLAEEGAQVVVTDINAEAAKQVADEIQAQGGLSHHFALDVTNAAAVENLLATVVETCGGLHLAVNNAGVDGVRMATRDYPLDNWHKLMDVNLNGVFYCMKYEIGAMLADGGGAIVNMSSVAGTIGFPGMGAYVASKHAVIGLTKSVALEFARSGVRVNAVCPGMIDTPRMQQWFATNPDLARSVLATKPQQRLAQPDQIAEAAVWLCSDAADWVSGVSLVIDGGGLNR